MKEICEALQASGLEGLKSLLQSRPVLARQVDAIGDLPLHAACSDRYAELEVLRSIAVIEVLVESYKEALSVPNIHNGMLPLHMACWFCDESIIRLLIQEYPGALQVPDTNGFLPIFFIVAKLEVSTHNSVGGWDNVKGILECMLRPSPATLWKTDNEGIVLLQHSIKTSRSNGKRLLELYLDITAAQGGLKMTVDHEHQWVPIHVAISSNTNVDVVKMIHAADPEAIHLKDHKGRSSIHKYLSMEFKGLYRSHSKEMFLWLLKTDPSALMEQDDDGKTPLHLLLENPSLFYQEDKTSGAKPTRSTLPGVLNFMSTSKVTQTHRNAWVQFVSDALLSSNPAICGVPDRMDGDLPLHLAIRNHCHPECTPGLIAALLQAFPRAIFVRNHRGQTALQIILSPHHDHEDGLSVRSLDSIYALVDQDPTSLSHSLKRLE